MNWSLKYTHSSVDENVEKNDLPKGETAILLEEPHAIGLLLALSCTTFTPLRVPDKMFKIVFRRVVVYKTIHVAMAHTFIRLCQCVCVRAEFPIAHR